MTWLLRIIRCPNSTHIDGTHVPVEEPSTASKAAHLFSARMSPFARCGHGPQEQSVGQAAPFCLATRWPQPLSQLRPAPPARNIANRDGDGLLLTHQHDQPLASGDSGVEQVPL